MVVSNAAPIGILTGLEETACALHPVRSRILEELKEPNSAAGLARRLDLPRQRLNYHLRELEKAGLIEEVEERRKGNCVERLVRSRSKHYLIDPRILKGSAATIEDIQDRFSAAYLMTMASTMLSDVANLQQLSQKAKKRLPTMSLQSEVRFASPQTRKDFVEELTQMLATLIAKYHDQKTPGGRCFQFNLGAYPALPKQEN